MLSYQGRSSFPPDPNQKLGSRNHPYEEMHVTHCTRELSDRVDYPGTELMLLLTAPCFDGMKAVKIIGDHLSELYRGCQPHNCPGNFSFPSELWE